jgi:translocation and assembly module TamB
MSAPAISSAFPPKRHRLARRFGIVVVLLCTLAGWLLFSASGLRALVAVGEGASGGVLRAEGVSGSLRGPLGLARLTVDLPKVKVELTGVALDWQFGALFRRKLAVTRLHADKAGVFLKDSPPAEPPVPRTPPQNLRLPFDFDLAKVEVGGVEIYGADFDKKGNAALMLALRASSLALSGDASRFNLRQLAVDSPYARVEASGEISTASPFALHAIGKVVAEEFSLDIEGSGSLIEPLLKLGAEGRGVQGRAEFAASPFAALPFKTAEINIDDFDPAALFPALPQAGISLHAHLAASDAGGTMTLRGPLQINNARPATLDAGGMPWKSLRTNLDGTLTALKLDDLLLEGGGGRLAGWLHWQASDNKNGEAARLPVDLGRLDASLNVTALDLAQIDSRLPARHVDGLVEAAATAQRQSASAALQVGAAKIVAEGSVAAVRPDAGGAAVPAFALHLGLSDFDPRALHPAAPVASIKLQASAAGALGEHPAATVHVELGDSHLDGKPLGGRGHFTWEDAHVRDVDLEFDFASNHLRLAGDWGEVADRLALDLDAPRLAVLGYAGLSGQLRASGTITGGLTDPAGKLRIDADKLHLPGEVEVAALAGSAQIDAGEAGPLALTLDGSGLVVGKLNVGSARISAEGQRDHHQIQIEGKGKFRDNAVRLAASFEGGLKELAWQGRILTLELAEHWPLRLRAPAALEIGADALNLTGAEFDTGEVGGGAGHLNLIESRWTSGGDSTTGRDSVVLRGDMSGLSVMLIPELAEELGQRRRRDPLTFGAHWDLRLDEGIEGTARLFRESGDVTVRGEIATRLGLDLLEAYLHAHDRRVTLVLAAHGQETGELGARLEAGVERDGQGWRLAPHAPLAGAARLNMPSLSWLGRLLRENVDISGAFIADVTAAGTPAAPDLQGRIAGHTLQLSFADQGLILAGGELNAEFAHHEDHQSLRLTRLSFESPNRVKPKDKRVPYDELTAQPGRLQATGEIALGLPGGEVGHFEFTADRLPLLQRSGRWLILSGAGKAQMEAAALNFDAQLKADAGYIEVEDDSPPSLGSDVVVRGKTPEPAAAGEDSETPSGKALQVAGKISIDLGRALYLSAFGVDTRLAGNLDMLLRPGDALRAQGIIRTAEGTFRGYGQRLNIERGTITFQGAPDNPSLNIVAMRRGLEVDAGVAITGDAHHPLVKLVSEPSVPDPEKLSWLILGRAPDAVGADMSLLMPAAQALFGGTGGGMTDEIARGLGFDSISIGQGDLNSSSRTATSRVVGGGSRISSGPAVSDDVVSVGKRLTNDLSLSFEQSLGGADSLVKLTYRLSRGLSLIARGGTDNSLDIKYIYILRNRDKEKARQEQAEKEKAEAAQAEQERAQ